MKITKCEGNGQGVCKRCGNIAWMTLLYKIENVQGIYCSNCVRKMKSLVEVKDMEFSTTVKGYNALVDELVGLAYKMGYCNGLLNYVDFDTDGMTIEVCTNDINNAFEYIINRVAFDRR